MLKRFLEAIKRYDICMGVNHDFSKSQVCSRCGYNINLPSKKKKANL